MGWSSSPTATRASVIAEHLAEWSGPGVVDRAIAHCTVGNHLWMVRERTATDATGVRTERYLTLLIMQRVGGEWCWKGVSESAGPFATSCPLRYLDLATHHQCPTWRALVAQRKALAAGQTHRLRQCRIPYLTLIRIQRGSVIGSYNDRLYRVSLDHLHGDVTALLAQRAQALADGDANGYLTLTAIIEHPDTPLPETAAIAA
jgi:hypothetical protein